MQLLESTTKKAEEGQEVVMRGASKSPKQRDEGGGVAGFSVPRAGRREDENLCMLEAHTKATASSRPENEAGLPSIQITDLEPGSAAKSNMSTMECKELAAAPSLYALSIISPIKEPKGQAVKDCQEQKCIGFGQDNAAQAHDGNSEKVDTNEKHIAAHESQASKDQQHEAATRIMDPQIIENMNQSPTSTYQNLIMSPSEQLADSRVAADNLKGGASGRPNLFNVAGHGQNLRRVDGYGGASAETGPNG